MTFNEFKNNVELWAAERGIYDHSSTEAQLMKALSELGELADAIIKGDDEALKDAVGDVAVCVINASYMESVGLDIVPDLISAIEGEAAAFANDLPQYVVGWIAWGVGSYLSGDRDTYDAFVGPMHALATLCAHKGLDLMDCCEHAWNEIKDRRGFLSPSGAFVKDEDEQKQDGGPAFPEGKGVGDVWVSNGGMTLRDYFAAKVIQGMVENDQMLALFDVDSHSEKATPASLMATAAYMMADAMLKGREK